MRKRMTTMNHVVSLLSLVALIALTIFILNVSNQQEIANPEPRTELTLDEQADLAVVEAAQHFKYGTIVIIAFAGCYFLFRRKS